MENLTPLQKAHAVMAARRAAGETIERLDPVQRAKRKPTSLKLAIAARCFQCQGEDQDPGVRQRIRDCGCEATCALWPHRPGANKNAAEPEIEQEAA